MPHQAIKTNKIQLLWIFYRQFVFQRILGKDHDNKVDHLDLWKDKLFANAVVYAIPISLFALVPSFIIAYYSEHDLLCVCNAGAFTALVFTALNEKIRLGTRKLIIVIILTSLSVLLIAYLGTFGIGSVYLIVISVFIAFLFSTRFAYAALAVNAIIYTAFGLIIAFGWFDSPLIENYTISHWIAYSLNFIFLNYIVVNQIRHILSGLEQTIDEESRLLEILQQELEEKEQRSCLLEESEAHYKTLFFSNPTPMWIFDRHSHAFLQINDAAVLKYGYSRDEFLQMSIWDIREAGNNNDDVTRVLKEVGHSGKFVQNIAKHRRKDGQLFYVEVRCGIIPFKGKTAFLVIARNITKQIEHTKAIELQNEKLNKIAYMQSHVVRAPLSRILGLTDLLKQAEHKDEELLNFLEISAKELDNVIRNIVDDTDEISPPRF